MKYRGAEGGGGRLGLGDTHVTTHRPSLSRRPCTAPLAVLNPAAAARGWRAANPRAMPSGSDFCPPAWIFFFFLPSDAVKNGTAIQLLPVRTSAAGSRCVFLASWRLGRALNFLPVFTG